MRFRMLPAATALVAVALLVGCVPQDPVIAPVPEPSSSPVFASDEEALAAATEAYGNYQRALDLALSQQSGRDLPKFSTGSALSSALELVSRYKANNWKQVGTSAIEDSQLVMVDQHKRSAAVQVQIYACHSVADVDVIDASGSSIVDAGRPDRTPFIATLVWDEALEHLIVKEDEVWSGSDFCV